MVRHSDPVDPAALTLAAARGGLKVMVVDDSRLQRSLLCRSLRSWGYRVKEADSAEAALDICRDNVPDIVLSDWMMPGLSGVDLCREMRKRQNDSYCYFILLTSKRETAEVVEGLDAGADDFLTKPVSNPELRARLMAGERILQVHQALAETNSRMAQTLTDLRQAHDVIEKDLQQARKLQQSLLRERSHAFDTGHLSLLLHSSGHVGGDLVGFFPAGEGHLGLFAIDVSGHGISSALMSARLAGYLSSSAPDQNVAMRRARSGFFLPREPAEAVEALNALVLQELETEHYFTFLLAILEVATGRVKISQAGQPHPILQRADGDLIFLGKGGFPVGLMPGVRFEQFELTLQAGDRLIILSDGVTECPDGESNLLGEEGLVGILEGLAGRNGDDTLQGIVDSLVAYAGTPDFPDDVSGIVLSYAGQMPK